MSSTDENQTLPRNSPEQPAQPPYLPHSPISAPAAKSTVTTRMRNTLFLNALHNCKHFRLDKAAATLVPGKLCDASSYRIFERRVLIAISFLNYRSDTDSTPK